MQAKEKKKVMLAEEEESSLGWLEKILSKYYDIRRISSGEQAFEILQDGFKASVILTDFNLRDMSGPQMLSQTLSIVPDAVRILITSETDPKKIVPAMNLGRAYMYLKKGAEGLEVLQSIRNGVNYYEKASKNKELLKQIEDLKTAPPKTETSKKEEVVEKQQPESNGSNGDPGAYKIISGLANLDEIYYFSNRNQAVESTVKALAKDLKISGQPLVWLLQAASMINITNYGIPVSLFLSNPEELEGDQLDEYIKYFRKPLNFIRKIDSLKVPAKLLGMIWESADGKGFPEGLEDVPVEAQVISIANIYHDLVYKITPDKYKLLRNEKEVLQSQVETHDRHVKAMKFFHRNASRFDKNIFDVFKYLVKNKSCNSLVPKRGNLKIRNRDLFAYTEPAQEENYKSSDDIGAEITIGDIKYIEKDILIDDLKPGMKVSGNIVSKSGMLIVRQEQDVTEGIVMNIQHLKEIGDLKETITILTPDHGDS